MWKRIWQKEEKQGSRTNESRIDHTIAGNSNLGRKDYGRDESLIKIPGQTKDRRTDKGQK